MKSEFECGVTASLLKSGRVLANFSNCAAIVAGLGELLAHTTAAGLVCGASLLCWPVACYFAVRVAIDASLFRELSRQPDDAGQALDRILIAQGLLQVRRERTLSDRGRGALRLWKGMSAVVAIQVLTLLAAMIVETLATR